MKRELLNIGSNGVRVGVRAAWGVILPGVLAVEAFGAYTLILGAAQILSTLALLGAPNVALSGTVDVRLLLVHTVVLGVVLAGALVALTPTSGAEAYIVIAVQVLALHALLSGWARGRGHFRELLVSYVAGYLLFAAIAIGTLATVHGFGPMLPLWLELIGPGASVLVLLWLVARYRSAAPAAAQPARDWRRTLRPVYAIGGLVVVDIIIWRRIEIFFLQVSPDGSEGVAVFGLAIQLATTALLLPTAVLEAWYPQFATAWATASDDFAELVRRRRRSYAAIYWGTTLLALAGFAAVIPFAYPAYRPWLALVLGLIAMRLAAGYFGFHSTVLYATGRELALYAPVIAGAVVALLANGLLTARYGLDVVPIAYAATHGTTAAGTWLVYQRRRNDRPPAPAHTPAEAGPAPTVDP